MSKFEQIISEIEDYIDNCSYVRFSNTKIAVVKEDLDEMLHELRLRTPEEVKNYQKLLKNKDRIISEANEQARLIIDTAQIQTNELVNEHEIMQRAYEEGQNYIDQAKVQAQQILDTAVEEANAYRQSVMEYADSLLSSIQGIIETTVNDTSSRFEGMFNNLNETLNVITANRNALQPSEEEESEEEEVSEESVEE